MPFHIDLFYQIPPWLHAGTDSVSVAAGFQLGHKSAIDGEDLDHTAFDGPPLGVDLLDKDGVFRLVLEICRCHLTPFHQNFLLRVQGDVTLKGQLLDLNVAGSDVLQVDLAVLVGDILS